MKKPLSLTVGSSKHFLALRVTANINIFVYISMRKDESGMYLLLFSVDSALH